MTHGGVVALWTWQGSLGHCSAASRELHLTAWLGCLCSALGYGQQAAWCSLAWLRHTHWMAASSFGSDSSCLHGSTGPRCVTSTTASQKNASALDREEMVSRPTDQMPSAVPPRLCAHVGNVIFRTMR